MGHFICFIGHHSFMQDNRQSAKITALTEVTFLFGGMGEEGLPAGNLKCICTWLESTPCLCYRYPDTPGIQGRHRQPAFLIPTFLLVNQQHVHSFNWERVAFYLFYRASQFYAGQPTICEDYYPLRRRNTSWFCYFRKTGSPSHNLSAVKIPPKM